MAPLDDEGSVSLSCLSSYLSAHFGGHDKAGLCTSPAAKAGMEVYRKHYSLPVFGQITAPPFSDGFLIALALCPFQLRIGRQTTEHFPPDSILIHELSKPLEAYIGSSFDILFLHIKRTALDSLAHQIGALPVERLYCNPGTIDPVLAGLGRVLLSALTEPNTMHILFVDQVAMAVNLHVAQHYGGLVLPSLTARRGLTPGQEKRAKECLTGLRGSDVTISDVAAECGLSRSYFIKSFKESTGKTPHRWLLEHRLSRARVMLAKKGNTIADVAIACGFADQSHLTRLFTREIGIPPSAWRRGCQV